MPSHTCTTALIDLYHAGGAPWNYPKWQEITGVRHGLFPDDDSLLPRGWTREDAQNVASYFSRYKNIVGECAKLKFAASRTDGGSLPGRTFWRTWVTTNWGRWKIHRRVIDVYKENDCFPPTILQKYSTESKAVSFLSYSDLHFLTL